MVWKSQSFALCQQATLGVAKSFPSPWWHALFLLFPQALGPGNGSLPSKGMRAGVIPS